MSLGVRSDHLGWCGWPHQERGSSTASRRVTRRVTPSRGAGSALAGDAGRQERALAGRALQLELAAERLYAVREPAQPGPAIRVSATCAVIADAQDDVLVVRIEPEGRRCRVRVLRDIGESFGGDVVDDGLDRRRQAAWDVGGELDR